MVKGKSSAALALLVGGLMVVAAEARPGEDKKTAGQVTALTALDYIQIQQLVSSYPFALDTGADQGYAYADLFTPDGTFGRAKGREALKALAWQHRPGQGPNYTRQFVGNVVITPTAEGATGKAYVTVIEFGDGKKPPVVEMGGHYEDVYVKTAAGWRFKTRTFIRSQPGQPPAAAEAATTQTPSVRQP